MANRAINRRAWTQKQDNALISIISQLPNHDQASLNWKFICEKFNQNMSFSSIFKRQTKQCRERWNNCLKPGLVQKKIWTHKEKLLLFENYKLYGQKWCKIAEHLPGRSDNNVKNYFYSSVRKLLRKFDKNISLYNRKIKAKKYQFMRISKITQNILQSASQDKKYSSFKLLRPITKEAINKLLLLAESKHTHKIQVTDDLECDLISKVRSRFINFLYENQLLQPMQTQEYILEQNDEQNNLKNRKYSQKQSQQEFFYGMKQNEEDSSVNNLSELQKFIEDLYEITTHTKKKKNGSFALGTLSQKQIQGIIKSKKKKVFKNKKIIKKELEQQHKNIVPCSKTIRALSLKEEQEERRFEKRKQQSVISQESLIAEPSFSEAISSKIVLKQKKIKKVNKKMSTKLSSKIKQLQHQNNELSWKDIVERQNPALLQDKKVIQSNKPTKSLPKIHQKLFNELTNQQVQYQQENQLSVSKKIEKSDPYEVDRKSWCKNVCIENSVQYLDANPYKIQPNYSNIFKSSNINNLSSSIFSLQNSLKYLDSDKDKKQKKNKKRVAKCDDKVLSIRLQLEKCGPEKQSFLNKIPTIKNNIQKAPENGFLSNSFGYFEINMSQQFPNLHSSIQFLKGIQSIPNFTGTSNIAEVKPQNNNNIEEDFLLRSASMYNQPLLRINNDANQQDSLSNVNNSRILLNTSNNYGLGSLKFDQL